MTFYMIINNLGIGYLWHKGRNEKDIKWDILMKRYKVDILIK